MLTICNEPVQPLANLRTPRIWQTILSLDLPGKIALARIQLNHALVDEERQTLDKRLLALYTNVIAQFAKRHGDSTRCFLVRAPESLNLVGHHIKEFGGATNGIACYETVFCVSPRTDGRVAISHVEERFAPVEFELLDGLPKARVLDWARHLKERAAQKPAASWADAIRLALQYYVNRHKGPTGQIELPIPGVNIVVGAILPAGLTTHSQTTLAAAALISLMGLTGEWGKLPLTEFSNWLSEADAGAHGRRSDPGPIVFGMPGEIVHVNYHPARAKGKALPHGFAFLTAHAGAKPACGHDGPKTVDVYKTPAVRATTTAAALALFRQIVKSDGGLGLGDNHVYELLLQIPERATRAEILKRIANDEVRAALQTRFASHDEPAGGYNLREKLLFVLSEIRRAHRAADVIRAGDPLGIAALMNVSQSGECTTFNDVNALGQVRETFAVPSCVSDAEVEAQALGDEPLWRQTGKSGASTIETDLLCDIALAVGGVLGARYVEPNRVAILCKAEISEMVLATLHSGYYGPRGFATPLAEQIFPCQGAGIVSI